MYESFYKLTCKPFALTPDQKFYFPSKEHNRVQAYLRYGISQGEGFIVVTGDVGAGKTTLIAALSEELSKQKNIISGQLVTTQLQPDDLVRMVSASLGLRYEGMSKSELLKGIENYLMKQAKAGKHVLLLIDEAQNLQPHSIEELRMLSNYQYGSKSILQSFLLGQGEFKETLRLPELEQFRQRIIASYHLGPMQKSEVHSYIEHRLKVAGWKSDPHISKDAYDVVFEYTDAIPRRINMLMDRVLLYAFSQELHDITGETVREVADELQDELHFTRTLDGENDASPATNANNTARMQIDEGRIEQLEKRLEAVEDIIKRTSELFRVFLNR